MEHSLTEGEQAPVAAVIAPTADETTQTTSAEQNQETNSREQSQESVSDDTAAKQTQTNKIEGGASTTDDELAGIAKSQNIDLATATDNEKRLLKVALDNQRAARNVPKQSITDTAQVLSEPGLEAEVAQLKYERTTEKFFQGEGIDKNLESEMVNILHKKVAELTPTLGEAEAKKYAFNLSRDLDTLYAMAQIKTGATKVAAPVDVEAIRREERESINRQLSSTTPSAHAIQGGQATGQKVTSEWIRNEYDPKNPEHRKLVDEYYSEK